MRDSAQLNDRKYAFTGVVAWHLPCKDVLTMKHNNHQGTLTSGLLGAAMIAGLVVGCSAEVNLDADPVRAASTEQAATGDDETE